MAIIIDKTLDNLTIESTVSNGINVTSSSVGGPRGPKGDQGDPGEPGAQGERGEAATVSVGTVTTLPAGAEATVTNSGTESDAILNFGIPKGDEGELETFTNEQWERLWE